MRYRAVIYVCSEIRRNTQMHAANKMYWFRRLEMVTCYNSHLVLKDYSLFGNRYVQLPVLRKCVFGSRRYINIDRP